MSNVHINRCAICVGSAKNIHAFGVIAIRVDIVNGSLGAQRIDLNWEAEVLDVRERFILCSTSE